MSLVRRRFDWKAACAGACASIVCVVGVSLAAANAPRQAPAPPALAAWPATIEPVADRSSETPPPVGTELLQAAAVAVFIAAAAAGPVWLISTAHHPHPRTRCPR